MEAPISPNKEIMATLCTFTVQGSRGRCCRFSILMHTLIHADGLPARVAVLGKHAVEAGQTIRPPVPHDVSLSPELEITLETRKVLHVPRAALGLGALVGEDDLRDRLAILAKWMTPPNNGATRARLW